MNFAQLGRQWMNKMDGNIESGTMSRLRNASNNGNLDKHMQKFDEDISYLANQYAGEMQTMNRYRNKYSTDEINEMAQKRAARDTMSILGQSMKNNGSLGMFGAKKVNKQIRERIGKSIDRRRNMGDNNVNLIKLNKKSGTPVTMDEYLARQGKKKRMQRNKVKSNAQSRGVPGSPGKVQQQVQSNSASNQIKSNTNAGGTNTNRGDRQQTPWYMSKGGRDWGTRRIANNLEKVKNSDAKGMQRAWDYTKGAVEGAWNGAKGKRKWANRSAMVGVPAMAGIAMVNDDDTTNVTVINRGGGGYQQPGSPTY